MIQRYRSNTAKNNKWVEHYLLPFSMALLLVNGIALIYHFDHALINAKAAALAVSVILLGASLKLRYMTYHVMVDVFSLLVFLNVLMQ